MHGVKTPTSRRKHRLFIDVTFSSAVSRRDAAKGLQLALDGSSITFKPVWLYEKSPYIDKLVVLEKSGK